VNGSYDKEVNAWGQRPDRQLLLKVRTVGTRRRLIVEVHGQEVYSCPSDDVVCWAMRIASMLDCDDLEQILRRLGAIDELRPKGYQMGGRTWKEQREEG
jgi:hypothetical protein